jgi:hypothetical protein
VAVSPARSHEREGRVKITLVVLGVVIVALLWRLISAVERIEDEMVAARRQARADPRSEDRGGT